MLNYNISLLKTIKEPLLQSFDEFIESLNDVMASNRSPKDVVVGPIVNIIGVVKMVGRTSLVKVAEDVHYSIEQLQKAEVMNWDHIRITEVAQAAKDVVVEMLDQIRALERKEKKSAASLWPMWAHLQHVMKKEPPQIEILFDPDPSISPEQSEQFSPLDQQTLNMSGQPHLARLESGVQTLSSLIQGDISQEEWEATLKQIESVFDWAYALKHRLGYHGYWLAARARLAYELLNFGNNSKEQNTQLLQSLKSAQVEIRKFVSDTRKPRPELVQQMMQPLLRPWPVAWDAIYGVLSELKEVFDLEDFWKISASLKNHKKDPNAQIVSDSDELLEAVNQLKSSWGNLSAAEEPDPRPFLRGLMTFLQKYEKFPNPGQRNLLEALKSVAHRFVSARRTDVSSDFSQEVAVCLLVIEETIARKGNWPKDLEKQSDLVRRRVQLAVTDERDQLHALPQVTWGVDKTRQQSQAAVSRVIKEVLNDLEYIEGVFDGFFRDDPQEAARHIDTVKTKMMTSLSILNALGQHNAVLVMQEVNQHIGLLTRPNPEDYKKEYGSLSIALTGLTTFLNAFEKGDDDALRLLEPALKHIGAQKEKDKALTEFRSSLLDGQTVEEEKAAEIETPALPSEVFEPEGAEPAEHIDTNHQGEEPPTDDFGVDHNDANYAIEETEKSDLEEDQHAYTTDAAEGSSLEEEGDNLFEEPTVAEPDFALLPSQDEMDQAQAAAQTAFENATTWVDKIVDEELAEAFFEEGVDVLSEIQRLRTTLTENFTKEALIDLRRQFHTLKGSARTTQLWGCGELGRRVEVRLNDLIGKNSGYSSDVDHVVDYAYNLFEVAFGELINTHEFTFDEDLLRDLATHMDHSYGTPSGTAVEVDDNSPEEAASITHETDYAETAENEEQMDTMVLPEHLSQDTWSETEVIEETVAATEQGVSEESEESEESPHSGGLSAEDFDAALVDLEAHSNNLIEVLNAEVFDANSLHWSSHTIAALARMLEQHRLHVFAKNMEKVLEKAIDLHDSNTHRGLSTNDETTLRNAAEVLLEKSSQLLSEPNGGLSWNAWEEQVEEDVGALEAEGFGDREGSDVTPVEDETLVTDGGKNDTTDEVLFHGEEQEEEQEEEQSISESFAVEKDENEGTVMVEVALPSSSAGAEDQDIFLAHIVQKMGLISQTMAEVQDLINQYLQNKNKPDQ